MQIAMIIEAWEPIWGGGQAHVLELSKKLAENHDCKIDIFTMNLLGENGEPQKKISEIIPGKIRLIRVGKTRSFHSFLDRIFWIFEVISEIKKRHHKKKYDLIHAHSNLPGISGKMLGNLLHIPIVYTVHGSNFLDLKKKSFFYFVERFLFTQIKYTQEISVSRQLLNYKNKNKPVCIPNGVDIEKFDRTYEKFHQQKDTNEFKIIFVGRLDKIKGIDLFINAIKKIENELKKKNVKVNLVGYGYEENNLKELSKKLDLQNIINFKGKLTGENLLKAYITSDLFILPSFSEGQPLTLLEAWASKLPVIVTNVGENSFFVKNKINGYIIPAKNSAVLAKTILKAIENPTLAELGKRGYKLAKDKYTWDNVAEKTYAIYKKTI